MAPSYASPQDSPTVKVLNFFLGGLSKAPEAVDEGDYGTAAVEIAGVLPWGKLLKVLKFARLFSHTDEAVDVTRAFRALPEDEALRIAEHAISRGHLPGIRGVSSADELARYADEVVANSPDDLVRSLERGRTAYWDPNRQVVLIRDPASPHGATFFRPRDGFDYFLGLE